MSRFEQVAPYWDLSGAVEKPGDGRPADRRSTFPEGDREFEVPVACSLTVRQHQVSDSPFALTVGHRAGGLRRDGARLRTRASQDVDRRSAGRRIAGNLGPEDANR